MPSTFANTFSVTGASQWDGGANAATTGSYFLGGDFDTGKHSIGGISSDFFGVDNGAKATFELAGRAGLDLSYRLFEGSLDASFTGSVSQNYTDVSNFAYVPINTSIAMTDGNFSTQSPSFGAALGFTADFEGSVSGKAVFAGEGWSASDEFSADLSQPNLIEFNRNADGRLRFLGDPIVTAVPGFAFSDDKYALRVQEVSGLPGFQAQLYTQQLLKETAEGETPNTDNVIRSLVGTIELTEPTINLSTTGLQANGTLSASSSITRQAQLASINLSVGGLVARALGYPVSPLNSTSISFGKLATLDITPMEFTIGPAAYALQNLTLTPRSQITYDFNRPIFVTLNGTNLGRVREVTFNAGDDLRLGVDGPLTVSPSWTFAADAHNSWDVAIGMHAAFDIGKARLSSNIGSTTVLRALGLSTAKSVGPVYSTSIDLDLGAPAISLLDRNFTVFSRTVAMPAFTLGQNIPLSLIVDHTADDGLIGSLRYAINSANALADGQPHVIVVPQGTYPLTRTGANTTAGGDLDVTDANLTIECAPGTIIDAAAVSDRVMIVAAGANLHLSGATLKNGHSTGEGGAVLVDGGTFTLSNSTVSHSSAGYAGGGIAVTDAGILTLDHVTVSNNTGGTRGGGGIYIQGFRDASGAVTGLSRSTASITSSTITNNIVVRTPYETEYGYGGGICNDGSLSITGSTVSSNSANVGGGIYTNYYLTVGASTINNNDSYIGGGIASDYSIVPSTAPDPGAFEVQIVDSTLSNNYADWRGGGLFNSALSEASYAGVVHAFLRNTTIANNTCLEYGGGIHSTDDVTASHVTISGNQGRAGAGGVFVGGRIVPVAGGYRTVHTGIVTLNNSIVAGNTAPWGDRPDVSGFFGSTAPNLIGNGYGGFGFGTDNLVGTADSPIDPKLGTLQDNSGSTWTMALRSDSPAIGVGTNQSSGAIEFDQRGLPRGLQNPDLGATEFLGNVTVTNKDDGTLNATLRHVLGIMDKQGGDNTIFLNAGVYRLTLAGLEGVSGDGKIGDLDLFSVNLTIQGAGADKTTIDVSQLGDRAFEVHASAKLTLSGVTIIGGDANAGGAIRNEGTTTLQNVALSGNSATNGGAIINDASGTLTIVNSTLSTNSAPWGGAVANNGTLIVRDSTFTGNQAIGATQSGGGAIYNGGGSATIQQSTIVYNSAVGNPRSGSYGGGIASANGTVQIDNSIVALNTAGHDSDLSGAFLQTVGHNFIGILDGATGLANGVLGNQVGGVPLADTTLTPARDPKLGPLQNNGGPTLTHAPLAGSPLIDKAATVAGETADQRGSRRGVGGWSDIGAVEDQAIFIDRFTDGLGVRSLRQAVIDAQAAGGPRTIKLVAGAYLLTLSGASENAGKSGDVDIAGNITLAGPSVTRAVIDASTLGDRAFDVVAGGTLSLNDVDVRGGSAPAAESGGNIRNAGTLNVNYSTLASGTSPLVGGAVANRNGARLTITGGTLHGNSAGTNGGAVSNEGNGSVAISSSTLDSNSAVNGGAMYNKDTGAAAISHSTISNNQATSTGGGIFVDAGTVSLKNTIVAANHANASDDFHGAFVSNGTNLIGDGSTATGFATGDHADLVGSAASPIDPKLGPLQNNGGPTLTRKLLVGSPAFDAGFLTGLPIFDRDAIDQRGSKRTLGDFADIGAVETEVLDPTTTADGIAPGTLRRAVWDANVLPGAQVIHLSPGTYYLTITEKPWSTTYRTGEQDLVEIDPSRSITNGALDIADELTIEGSGSGQTAIDASLLPEIPVSGWVYGHGRVLNILANPGSRFVAPRPITANINNVTIRGGSEFSGGNIMNASGSTLNITDCVVESGFAFSGGNIDSNGPTSIVRSTIRDGQIASAQFANGAGIWIHLPGSLYVDSSTFTGNGYDLPGESGGAICADAPTTIVNSTISGNGAFVGGGIALGSNLNSSLTIVNSTITGNAGYAAGGGIAWATAGYYEIIPGVAGGVTLRNTIVADNWSMGLEGSGYNFPYSPDVIGSFVSLGNNLIGNPVQSTGFTNGVNGDIVGTSTTPIAPLLSPLRDNGGPTLTHALLPGSPALGAGDDASTPLSDQRLLPRNPSDNDIGAYELIRDLDIYFPGNGAVSNLKDLTLGLLQVHLPSRDHTFEVPAHSITLVTSPTGNANVTLYAIPYPITMTFAGSGAGDRLTLEPGAILNAAAGQTILDKDTLAGAGTIDTDLTIKGGAHLTPGLAGPMTVKGDLTLESGARFGVNVNGNGASQLVANGTDKTVKLDGAILDIEELASTQNAVGHQLTILKNETGKPISGTFANLPEGTEFQLDGDVLCSISYRGGASGADIVLSVYELAPSISVTKTPSITSISEGGAGDQTVTYTYTIKNTSPAAIGQVTLTSIADAHLGDLLARAVAANGGSAVLAHNALVTWTESVTVPAGNVGDAAFVSGVDVSASDSDGDSTAGSASASVDYTDAAPSLNVTVSAGVESVNVGGSVIYTYTITNTSAASTDPITLTSISDDKVGDLLDHAITANGGSATLAPGDSVTWTETVAMPSSGNAFANTVTVNSHDDEATSANDEASASVNLTFTISGVVFRDSIMNGTHDASEQKLANWTIYLYKETNGVAGYQTGSGGDQRVATAVSDSNGSYSFAGLLAGSYYTRGAVNSGWTQTAGDMNITNPTCENLTDNFGYLELKTTGRARGIGYWGGTQGKSVITYSGTDNDITFLNALNLVDDKGARVTWANTSAGLAAFQTWLNNSAKAKNMAYMLSAQLAAMQLNVRHGYASASTYVSIGSIALVGANLGAGDFIGGTYQTHNGNIYVSIQDLMDSANASLGDQALTLAGNSYRSRQEALKNILEVLNSDRAYYLM